MGLFGLHWGKNLGHELETGVKAAGNVFSQIEVAGEVVADPVLATFGIPPSATNAVMGFLGNATKSGQKPAAPKNATSNGGFGAIFAKYKMFFIGGGVLLLLLMLIPKSK